MITVRLVPGGEPLRGRLHAAPARDGGTADAVPRQPRPRLLPRQAHVQPPDIPEVRRDASRREERLEGEDGRREAGEVRRGHRHHDGARSVRPSGVPLSGVVRMFYLPKKTI